MPANNAMRHGEDRGFVPVMWPCGIKPHDGPKPGNTDGETKENGYGS